MVTPGLYLQLTEGPEPATDDGSGSEQEDEDYQNWNWVKAEGLKHSLTSGIHITAMVALQNGLQPVKSTKC